MNNTPMHSSSTIQLNHSHKSHKKLLVIVGIILTVFIVIPVFIVAWLGFVPGLSDLLGAKKAKDLGIRYSASDLDSYNQKTAVKFLDYNNAPVDPKNPSSKTALAAPITSNNIQLSDEELTAALNNTGWAWMPITNTQARFSEGAIEISGNLDLDNIQKFEAYINESGGNNQDFENAMTWVKRIANNAPVYAKANAQINNNELSFTLLSAQIGRLDIPLGSAEDLKNPSAVNIESDYLKVQSAKLKPGTLDFNGTYPSEIYLRQ